MGDEVREVDGGVDAHGCEGCAGVDAGGVGLGKNPEIGNGVFEPGGCREEFIEPLARGAFMVFVAVVDESL